MLCYCHYLVLKIISYKCLSIWVIYAQSHTLKFCSAHQVSVLLWFIDKIFHFINCLQAVFKDLNLYVSLNEVIIEVTALMCRITTIIITLTDPGVSTSIQSANKNEPSCNQYRLHAITKTSRYIYIYIYIYIYTNLSNSA